VVVIPVSSPSGNVTLLATGNTELMDGIRDGAEEGKQKFCWCIWETLRSWSQGENRDCWQRWDVTNWRLGSTADVIHGDVEDGKHMYCWRA
jgi:hypothetical protein